MKGKPTKISRRRRSKSIGGAVVRSVAALIANEAVNRERLDRLDAVVRNLSLYGRPTCEDCRTPLPIVQLDDGTRSIQNCELCQPQAAQTAQPTDDGIVIPAGADPAGHWHASCVHGFEWGNNCRCIPARIEYQNVACPRFCEGTERRITRARSANVH